MKDIVELTRLHLNETPDSDDIELLNEFISLKTGAIALGLGKVKQYANQIDREVTQLKSHAKSIRTSTPEKVSENLADALESIGNLLYLQRKMGMYTALTAAATTVGIDKSTKILQRMEKKKK